MLVVSGAVMVCLVLGVLGHGEGGTTINIYTKDAQSVSHTPSTDSTSSTSAQDVVAFSVGRTSDFSHTADTYVRIPMNKEIYNDGGYYDMTNNYFTAPVTGLYSFYYGASGDSGKITYVLLYAGNPEVAIVRSYDYTKGHGHAGGRMLMKLNAGERASMWNYGGATYGLDGNQVAIFFNGYLVHKL